MGSYGDSLVPAKCLSEECWLAPPHRPLRCNFCIIGHLNTGQWTVMGAGSPHLWDSALLWVTRNLGSRHMETCWHLHLGSFYLEPYRCCGYITSRFSTGSPTEAAF